MMDWIETADGYVRKDAIIEVHIDRGFPGVVGMVLISGDWVIYKDFGKDSEGADTALSELMDLLTGHGTYIHKFD